MQQNPKIDKPSARRVGNFPGPSDKEFKSDLIPDCTYVWYASIVSLSKSFSFILKDVLLFKLENYNGILDN